MKIKHTDITIDKADPFQNCKLDRKHNAEILTNIVSTYSDGFVLAINNEWGTGKTTFVKMWQQSLINKDYKTIYFNAWENDFDNNPLIAIMSELKSLTNQSNEKIFQSALQKGAILVKNIAPSLLKSFANKYFDMEVLSNAVENTTKALTKILENEIKIYADKKKSVIEFRNELEKFIDKTDNTKPIVFIIDELDRCRPNYAVEVLEQMKHFFSVHGIVFVLSIDKVQLGHAIRGVYGNEQINSEEYLRRFIDLEYSLPQPSIKAFVDYLYKYFSFDDFFASEKRSMIRELAQDKQSFISMATILFNKKKSTLRQQEKIFGRLRLVLNSFDNNNYIFPHLLIFLVHVKTFNPDLYLNIENNTISLQNLADEFSNLLLEPNDYNINFTYEQALLLHFYNNEKDNYNREKLYTFDENNKAITTIISKFDNNANLAKYFNDIDNPDYRNLELSHLINKINLTDPFIIVNGIDQQS